MHYMVHNTMENFVRSDFYLSKLLNRISDSK